MAKEKRKKEKENIAQNPYKTNGFLSKIPYWVKAIFIKYWFFGAICFFVGMGLSLTGTLYAVVAGLIGGSLTDLVSNNLLLMMDSDEKESFNFMMYKSKSILSFIINVVYGLVIFYISAQICSAIVGIIYDSSSWFLSSFLAEPLSQGLVILMVDMFFIGIKDLIVFLVRKSRKGK